MKKLVLTVAIAFFIFSGNSFFITDPTHIYVMDKVIRLILVGIAGFWGGWIIAAISEYLNTNYVRLKPILDRVVALLGLILSAPLFPLIALAIKLDSPGPVFYRQLRVGKDRRRKDRRKNHLNSILLDRRTGKEQRHVDYGGKPFEIIKFRSMHCDAERGCGPVWAKENDPRVTRLGAMLRRTHLDELPQLINVVRGDMSLVGPRPERPHFVMRFKRELPGYSRRLRIKPGVTGLAQVCHRADRCLEDVVRKLNYDLSYMDNISAGLDLRIFAHTIRKAFTGKTGRVVTANGSLRTVLADSFRKVLNSFLSLLF